jgi:peptidoglycan/xylan/chitin deacetylase (PgdA/CDA1 family)
VSTPTGDMTDLYHANTPASFWKLLIEPAPTEADWDHAVRAAACELPESATAGGTDIKTLLMKTLGEGQFGSDHFQLSTPKQLYYAVKPLIPRWLSRLMRQAYRGSAERAFPLDWPIELRYARFQWAIVCHLLERLNRPSARYIEFWPSGHPYAFVLTHDVETEAGQAYVRAVADLDAAYGFRSSFNFVPERYPLDYHLIDELRERGFEIGVHGLKHDGKDFRSRAEFLRRAARINQHLRELGAVGFRAPLTHRQPEWMQSLEIEYDLSFFDTDRYEPMSGGTMCLWPYTIGRFVELPYTLVQDYTLTAVLKQTTPRLWLEKVDVIRRYSGLALVNVHPDYLRQPRVQQVYEDFLQAMRRRADFWHALPRDVARWWRARGAASGTRELDGAVEGTITFAAEPAAQNLPPPLRGRVGVGGSREQF